VLLLRVYPTFVGNPTFLEPCWSVPGPSVVFSLVGWIGTWSSGLVRTDHAQADQLRGCREKKPNLFFAVWYSFCGRRLSSCFRFDACSGVIFIAGTPRGQCALNHRGALPGSIDPCEVGPCMKRGNFRHLLVWRTTPPIGLTSVPHSSLFFLLFFCSRTHVSTGHQP
jgi:hypothetical protein